MAQSFYSSEHARLQQSNINKFVTAQQLVHALVD